MEEGYSRYPLDFVGAAELPSVLHREALEGVLHQVRQDTACGPHSSPASVCIPAPAAQNSRKLHSTGERSQGLDVRDG